MKYLPQPFMRSFNGFSVPRGVLLAAGVIWFANELRARRLRWPLLAEEAFLKAADAVVGAMAAFRASPPMPMDGAAWLRFNDMTRALLPALAFLTKETVVAIFFPPRLKRRRPHLRLVSRDGQRLRQARVR
jgi:hypothetical protein